MAVQESTSNIYISLIDTKRRIAVRIVSSLYKGSRWEKLKDALKAALAEAEKIPKKDKKTFILYNLESLKEVDITKL